MNKIQYLIVCGNPLDGFNFYGPFAENKDAHAYAANLAEGEYWVTKLAVPKELK